MVIFWFSIMSHFHFYNILHGPTRLLNTYITLIPLIWCLELLQLQMAREVSQRAWWRWLGMCSRVSFSSRPVTALGLTFKVKTMLSCKVWKFVRVSIIWIHLCHLWSVNMDSLVVKTFPRLEWVFMQTMIWSIKLSHFYFYLFYIFFHWHFSSLVSSLTVCRYPLEFFCIFFC